LEGDIFNNCVEGLSTKLDSALGALISGGVLEEIFVNTTFAISTHAFIDCMSISIYTFA
jgi:hypothetical protein